MLPLLLSLSLLQAPAANPRAPDLYRRTLSRTLASLRAELRGGLNLEVDHSRWEDPWVVKTAHFEVSATRSYLQTVEIARQLEYMHGEMTRVLGEARGTGAVQRVWIFPNIGDYNRYGGQHGAEHSSLLGAFYANQVPELPVVTYQNGNPTLLGMWITHGMVHQYLEQTFGPQRALWVDEGLASYFALYWDWAYGARELERIKEGPGLIHLERLVEDPIQAYAERPADRFIELGMLFHFLLNSCEETRNGATGDPSTGPFQEFLRAAVRGQDVRGTDFMQTFEEASGLLEEDFANFPFAK